MILSRRNVLQIGGLLLAGLPLHAAAEDAVAEVVMHGNADGSKVWFDPIGFLVRPGQTVRWINRDRGNSHTATSYHPNNDGHPLRIPEGAEPWNSDYLLPDESFEARLTAPGVYDYFCIPHEHAGMVGRIVVMAEGAAVPSEAADPLPAELAHAFPTVAEIMRLGSVPGKAT